MSTTTGIGARIDAAGSSWAVWRLIVVVSLGGFFEFYDLMMTAYVSPGLVRAGVFHAGPSGLLGLSDQGVFAAATFLGLFLGALAFAGVADRYGRRAIFTVALVWYSAATLIMAASSTAAQIDLWRLVAGIGVGVELVTIDVYIAEIAPPSLRGRAFAVNQSIQFLAVPTVALAAWLLIPQAPFGVAGWRWVMIGGATGALVVWLIRRGLPESPRWLEQRGRGAEAAAIVARIAGSSREPPATSPAPPPLRRDGLFSPLYRRRTTMLIVLNVAQAIGYYGFSNWVPSLIAAQGHAVVASLRYSFAIALAFPLAPLICALFADFLERKLQIALAAFLTAAFGLVFARQTAPVALFVFGVAITFSINLLSFAYHAYQAELFPTRMRAFAVGFVYSFSRLSTVFSSLIIAALLTLSGATAVFVFIAGAMAVVIVTVLAVGPRSGGAALERLSP